MKDAHAALLKAFALQSDWCQRLGSPFTSALIARLAEDFAAGGPTAALLTGWPGPPLADAVSLRMAGALHAAALSGRDPALAGAYPWADPAWRIDTVWPIARAYLARDHAFVAAFIKNAPQTNETRRTIGLLPGFLACAARGPLHLLELGASAGLNLHWPSFRFQTSAWAFGPVDGATGGPMIDTDWQGPAPADLATPVTIAARAGVDINPLDLRDPQARLRLKAYVWPDQPDRLARIDAAMALAAASDLAIDRADAGDWLAARLAAPLPEGVTVVFHSVVWQYLPAQTKDAVSQTMAAAAARADSQHQLAWLRYEPHPVLEEGGAREGMGVDLRLWPGGVRRRFLETDGHARFIRVLGED